MSPHAIAMTRALAKVIRKAIKKDRSVRYKLNQPWTFPYAVMRGGSLAPDYEGRTFSIREGVMTIQPNTLSDGATLAPEKGAKEGAQAHDIIYTELEEFARSIGHTVAQARQFADDVLYGIMLQFGGWARATVYYYGARIFGGAAHAIGKLLLLTMIAAATTGGCIKRPFDPFEGRPIDPPDMERIDK